MTYRFGCFSMQPDAKLLRKPADYAHGHGLYRALIIPFFFIPSLLTLA
jgi:hypothetical protein